MKPTTRAMDMSITSPNFLPFPLLLMWLLFLKPVFPPSFIERWLAYTCSRIRNSVLTIVKRYITWTCFKENAKVIMNVLYIVKRIILTITRITYKEKNTFLGYLRQSYIIWATLSSKVSWLSKSLYVQESWKEIYTHHISILHSHNI